MKLLGKLLLGAAALVVVALVSLFFLSRRRDAGRVDTAVAIARPPAAVFPWLVEEPRLKQWMSALGEIRTSATGPTAVGQKATFVMRDANTGKAMELESEVTAVDPPRLLAIKLTLPGIFAGTVSYTLTEQDGGTLLTYQSHFDYQSALYSTLEPLITPQARKKLEQEVAGLKAKVEQAPVASR